MNSSTFLTQNLHYVDSRFYIYQLQYQVKWKLKGDYYMPSTYAHYRFGQEVFQNLSFDMQNRIMPHMDLFNIGLHGPDLLFYYHPLISNPINQIGYGTHERSGRDFFDRAGKILIKKKLSDAHFAYICGFICHFSLDRECHGYIDKKIAKSGVSHTEIEVEFDRRLLIHDGFQPVNQILTKHIHPTMENAKVIKDFFSETSNKQILKALESIIYYNNILVVPNRIKRYFVFALLKVTGNYKEMHGLIVNYKANPDCKDSNRKLMELYKKAEENAKKLISEFMDNVSEKAEWSELYQYTFGSKYVGGKQ